ncbi:MAG: hypothetical protein LLG03_02360 [Planctomycetaceae bacterium]|nr:hypothetical protein [Planctomycetaceae bacterium]
MAIPRNEYPRPQFVRKDWLCLNGPWEFEIDAGDTGAERGLTERPLADKIIVPFCPESKLSGLEHLDFMNTVWYRRTVSIPKAWSGRNVLLHFEAVDYEATVWVNGRKVGQHRGGWCGFTCDLTGAAQGGGKATIVVRARDLRADAGKPAGKQINWAYHPSGCNYPRTTGIWQSVWMEPVPAVRLNPPRITPDVRGGRFLLTQPITNSRPGTALRVTLRDAKGIVCTVKADATQDFTPTLDLPIPKSRRRLWCCEDPFLYDIRIELLDGRGKVIDAADSYAGLRSITIDGKAVKLNGRSVFQRLVLDQGYYPDGILTAPSDAALVKDIELSMAAGFNGARLHQKVFEERFLYHADRMGYIVWGEFGDWGMDRRNAKATYITQWLEVLERDYSHPSIVGWCPQNESAEEVTDDITGTDDLTFGMYYAAKAMDTTRPVLDTSGYSHRVPDMDIYDSHDYDQDAKTFAERHAGLAKGAPYINRGGHPDSCWSEPYRGQPFFVSEFGGIWWNPKVGDNEPSWGYGQRPIDMAEFYKRFEGLCNVLLDDPNMMGYCYTQITDVFQEQNGILYFDRGLKFDMKKLHAIQSRKAAIEK